MSVWICAYMYVCVLLCVCVCVCVRVGGCAYLYGKVCDSNCLPLPSNHAKFLYANCRLLDGWR